MSSSQPGTKHLLKSEEYSNLIFNFEVHNKGDKISKGIFYLDLPMPRCICSEHMKYQSTQGSKINWPHC